MDFADLMMVDIAGGSFVAVAVCFHTLPVPAAVTAHYALRLTPYRGPRLLLYQSLAVSLFSTRVGRIFQIRGRHREQRAERTETAKALPQAGETVVVVEERRHSTAQRQQQQQQQQQQQWVQRTTSSAKWFLHTTSQSAQLQPSSEASSSLPWATATRRQLQLLQLLLQQLQTVSSTLRRPSMTSLRPPTRPKHRYHGAKTQHTLPYDLIR